MLVTKRSCKIWKTWTLGTEVVLVLALHPVKESAVWKCSITTNHTHTTLLCDPSWRNDRTVMEGIHGDLLHAATDHLLVQSTTTSLALDGYCGRWEVPPRVSDQHSRTTWRGLRTLHQLSACRPHKKVSKLCSSGFKRNATA